MKEQTPKEILAEIVKVEQRIYDVKMAEAKKRPEAWNEIEKLEWKITMLSVQLEYAREK